MGGEVLFEELVGAFGVDYLVFFTVEDLEWEWVFDGIFVHVAHKFFDRR